VTVRSLFSLAAAVGLGLAAGSVNADQPAPTYSSVSNQKMADEVAARIRKSGMSAGAKVSVNAQNGVVELSGEVRNQKQAEQIVGQIFLVPGVVKVQTSLVLSSGTDVRQAQAAEPAPMIIAPSPLQGGSVPSGPQEPMPLVAPGQPNYDMTGPRMPPYSWPTYAPYNNASRIAYPQAYPYNAFPFIGPYYPFPKVPLGWRSVKLEWDDGHWYLGRLSTPYDYWRVRFW
jgi:hypothetical protein